ncbi:GntR family transcriptional regulator [Microbacterium sp. NPDC089189]|uniref:GntR family transcriptional regulator n=1 Tax=Microbacterium sp. NPDC089189 TaxID=3154972 RepID=UPI0034281841
MTAGTLIASPDEGSPAVDIYRQLRALIVSGQLGVNERLPTVRQMAADLGVAPGTAAKAYKMLEQDGLVISKTAAGTRVAASAALLPRSVIALIRDLADEATSTGADLHDVIAVLKMTWPAPSDPAHPHLTAG